MLRRSIDSFSKLDILGDCSMLWKEGLLFNSINNFCSSSFLFRYDMMCFYDRTLCSTAFCWSFLIYESFFLSFMNKSKMLPGLRSTFRILCGFYYGFTQLYYCKYLGRGRIFSNYFLLLGNYIVFNSLVVVLDFFSVFGGVYLLKI